MREVIKISLLSILCVATVSGGAFAAASVRAVGGSGTYDSAASAATSARSGSLRVNGIGRPTATVSSVQPRVDVESIANDASSQSADVSTSGTTVSRAAASPRLSIGKYIGVPKSISSGAGGKADYADFSDVNARLDRLETGVSKLESYKQDILQSSEYIIVDGDELLLDVEKVKEDMGITDAREIELSANDSGLFWRYVGDEEWTELLSWDAMKDKLGLDEMNQTLSTQITNLRNDLTSGLESKLDKAGYDAIGKALVVDSDGEVKPIGEFAEAANVYTKTEVDNKIAGGLEDLGLGALAYKNTIKNGDVASDAAISSDKMSAGVQQTLGLANDYLSNAPASGNYVLSVDDGEPKWLLVE